MNTEILTILFLGGHKICYNADQRWLPLKLWACAAIENTKQPHIGLD